MSKNSRNIVIFVCVICCTLIAGGPYAGRTVDAQTKKNEPIEDPFKDSTILVEGFVVEVRLTTLYELEVSPIGEKPNSVSIDNILRCLQDKNNARITSGAKAAVRQHERGTTESEQRIYFEQQIPDKISEGSKRPAVPRSVRPYQLKKSFSASANILASNRISVSFGFEENAIEKYSVKDDMPPDTVNRQWTGTVCLERGKASIVGATQDEKKAVFLILCADIMDE